MWLFFLISCFKTNSSADCKHREKDLEWPNYQQQSGIPYFILGTGPRWSSSMLQYFKLCAAYTSYGNSKLKCRINSKKMKIRETEFRHVQLERVNIDKIFRVLSYLDILDLFYYTSIWLLYITFHLIFLENHVTGRTKRHVSRGINRKKFHLFGNPRIFHSKGMKKTIWAYDVENYDEIKKIIIYHFYVS